MKELSIEEKAKFYDEAKLRMSAAYNSNRCTIGFMNEIFPELTELEDEKIKKAIGYAIGQSTHSDGTLINGVSSEEALAWLEKQGEHANFRNKIQIGDRVTRNEDGVLVNLSQLKRVAKKDEKQGEQKPADKVEPKFKVGDTIYYNSFGEVKSMVVANVVTDSTDNPMYEDENGSAVFEKDLVEQKPAWSEEDKNRINRLIAYFEDEESFTAEDDIVYANWLKSLKERYTWKPSDEQMEGIECTIKTLRYQLNAGDNRLDSLYDDLKKLREE